MKPPDTGGDHKQDPSHMPNLVLGTQRIHERADPPQWSDCTAPVLDRSAMPENVRTGGFARKRRGV